MPKYYVQTNRGLLYSKRISALGREDELALALFLVLRAEADAYGRYTADPELFAHKLGGLLQLSADSAKQAISSMEAAGLVRVYEVDGEAYLQLIDYFEHAYHDGPAWGNFSKPEYPAPAGWEPPEGLASFIRDHHDQRNVTPERYGLGFGISDAVDRLLTEIGHQPNSASTHCSTGCSTDCSTHCSTGCSTGCSTDLDLDLELDSDTQHGHDVTRRVRTGSEASAEPTADGNGSGQVTSSAGDEDLNKRLTTLLADLSREDRDLVDEYFENLALVKGKPVSSHQKVREATALVEIREEFGINAWRHGVAAANETAARPCPAYVRTAAENYRPEHQGRTRYAGRRRDDMPFYPVPRPDEYELDLTNKWGEVIGHIDDNGVKHYDKGFGPEDERRPPHDDDLSGEAEGEDVGGQELGETGEAAGGDAGDGADDDLATSGTAPDFDWTMDETNDEGDGGDE